MIELTPRVQALKGQLDEFMRERVLPRERQYYRDAAKSNWQSVPLLDQLKREAKSAGLWNLFMPDERFGPGLTNWEYGLLCEEMGRSPMAAPCRASSPHGFRKFNTPSSVLVARRMTSSGA